MENPGQLSVEINNAAIRAGRVDDSSLIARKLADMRTLMVASDTYLATHGTPIDPRDLKQHACILDTNFRDPLHWRFAQGGQTISLPISGRLRYSNAEACLKAAEMGLGIANVPDFVGAPAVAAGRVRRVLQGHEAAAGGIWAIYPPGRHLAAKVRVLVDFLTDRFRGGASWEA